MVYDFEIPEVPDKKEEKVEFIREEPKKVPEIEPKVDPKIQELTNIVNSLEFLSNQVAVNNTTIKLLSDIKGLLEEVKKNGKN